MFSILIVKFLLTIYMIQCVQKQINTQKYAKKSGESISV